MKCKFCGLRLIDGQCKVPIHGENKKVDYAHPGCWIVWSKYQIKLQKLSEAYEFKLRAIKSKPLFIIDEIKGE